MGGSINSADRSTGYTKYIGTKLSSADGKDWYATIAAASPVAGDKILVVAGYTIAAAETWSWSNVSLDFLPNVTLTSTVAAGTAITISGSGVTTNNMNLTLNGNANGILLSATSTHNNLNVSIVGTVTTVFTLGAAASNNRLISNIKISGGTFTNAFVNSSTAVNVWDIATAANVYLGTSSANLVIDTYAGSIVSFNRQIQANNGITTNDITTTSNFSLNAGTYMASVLGYARISSPTQTIKSAGSESLDCSTQHIFYKTGGTATITLSNLVEGQTVNLILRTIGAAYTITWSPAIIWGPTGIPTPTNATAGSKYDFYTFIKVGSLIFGVVVLAMA